jgi:hypothetical protein
MLPGPDYIYKCPACDNFVYKQSLASGSNSGVRYFSDCRKYSPMMPIFPIITRCKKCSNIFWLSKQKEFAVYFEDDKREKEHEKPQLARKLSIDDYFEALEKVVYENAKDEFFIRKQIWWTYNDRVRIYPRKMFKTPEDEPRWKENLLRLIELIDILVAEDEDPDLILMQAEIYRNLGYFEKCMSLVKTIENLIYEDQFTYIEKSYNQQCLNKNRDLFELEDF